MTTYVYGPTRGRAWLNLAIQRDGAAYELWLNPRPPLALKLPLAPPKQG